MSQKHEYFGKYILLEKLATGGMAEVFLARAPGAGGIGKYVAIKKILPQYSDNPEFIQMFKDEAAIAINLSHSNIVSIYEFGIEKKQLFLAMDYVQGRNLRQILNKMKQSKAKFGMDQIIFMIKEVAAGLDHAHRSVSGSTGKPLNITHRDMSPQNVMVSFEGEMKIVDFGIAKAESQVEQTKTGTLKGKFGYMSPEQAEGQTLDLRTDIFSTGIVLWELLANDRLFTANNEINTLRKIRECQIPSLTKINPNINPELERIAQKALARDRNLRYQTAAAFHRDLNRFLNRQYPDFSPHDFSVFIKTLYADEILETRKRLIDYSKIPFKEEVGKQAFQGEEQSITSFPQQQTLTNTNKLNVAQTQSDFEDTKDSIIQTNPMDLINKPESTITETDTGNEEDDDSIRTENVLNPDIINSSLNNKLNIQPRANTGSYETMSGPIGEFGDPIEIEDFEGDRPMRRVAQRKASRNSFMSLFVFMAFVVGGYFALKMIFPDEVTVAENIVCDVVGCGGEISLSSETACKDCSDGNKCMSINGKKQCLKAEDKDVICKLDSDGLKICTYKAGVATNNCKSGDKNCKSIIETGPSIKTTPAAKGKSTFLIVNSIPSGAEIYINSKNTNKTTPSRVQIPAKKSFSLNLKKNRYIDYERTEITAKSEGRTLTATLQKALIGYVNIDVKPLRNQNVYKVYINGTELKGERLPISRRAVPADTELTIRAINPINGATAQKRVRVRRDQRVNVNLKLTQQSKSIRYKRKPTGK